MAASNATTQAANAATAGTKETFADLIPEIREAVNAGVAKTVSEKGAPQGWDDYAEGAVTPAATGEPSETQAPAEEPEAPAEAETEEAPAEPQVDEATRERSEDRYHKLVDDRKAADERADSAERELTALKADKAKRDRVAGIREKLTDENLPEGFHDWQPLDQMAFVAELSNRDLAEKVDSLQPVALERAIDAALPKLTKKQLKAVVDVAEAHPGLSPQQARAIARDAKPSLFSVGKTSPTSAMPPSQRTTSPSTDSVQPPRPDSRRSAHDNFVAAAKSGDRRGMHLSGVDMVKATYLSGKT